MSKMYHEKTVIDKRLTAPVNHEEEEVTKKIGLVVLVVIFVFSIGYFVHITHAKTKYVKKEEVKELMKEWNRALGVKCSFCHTSNRSETYKSFVGKTVGEKELKALVHRRIARAMQGYMLYMNKKEKKNYTCYSCHKGNKNVKMD
ncbi:MAG: hypothetical protein JRG73_13190 [Deltaproteobacteria bacterium]|nr:hypothetical protein [Deltaproteobacteria bacterium]